MKKDKTGKEVFREWLEKLQQESWQLELLISGFALFGIYSSRPLIADLEFYKDTTLSDGFSFIAIVVIFIIKTGWLIFFVNLVVHVILRGLWIGAIGLRYVSNEIEYDALQYSDRFTNFLKENVGSYDDFIERLERICSVIFAYTFLLFLLFFSLMIFMLHLIAIVIIAAKFNLDSYAFFFLFPYLLIALLVFIDLISLGIFKKIKEDNVSKAYYYLYRYFSFITLSFLYRPLLYNFIDHPFTRKLFYLSIPYIFIVIGGYTMFENVSNPFLPEKFSMLETGIGMDNYYYDDLRSKMLQEFPDEDRKIYKQNLKWVSLENFDLEKKVSSIFFRINHSDIRLMAQDSTIYPYKKHGLSFSWFGNNKETDPNLQEMEDQRKIEMGSLRDFKSELKRTQRKTPQASISLKIDSLDIEIEKAGIIWSQKVQTYQFDKMKQIRNAFASSFMMDIDSLPVALDQCFLYTHHHFGEQGLKCIYSVDSLDTGVHHVKVFRKYLGRNSTQIQMDSLILPIIKH